MYSVADQTSFTSSKIVSVPDAAALASDAKRQGKTVGLCHGGFDLLHPGHVRHFESAKRLCDILIVSVTSDRFVSGRKGDGRPVFPQTLRAYMIAALSSVDVVTITDMERATDAILAIRPAVYIKGAEYRSKTTPGITAERACVASVGGEVRYTDDPKLSTTEIISYIRELPGNDVLVIADRDGTLIENDAYFGREGNWNDSLVLNRPVVDFLSALQRKFRTTVLVVSNQSGVARGYFDERRVCDINARLALMLKDNGITVDAWQYCPDVDTAYASAHPEIPVGSPYVKPVTVRKPSPAMVESALAAMGKTAADFSRTIVIGNGEDDRNLAANLNAGYINVPGKSVRELWAEAESTRPAA